MDNYVARLSSISDEELKREWTVESGERRRQIEHEMAMRFRKPVQPLQLNYLNKFLSLADQFLAAYSQKDWFQAKYIYDTALRVGMFLEIPEQIRKEFFGISQEDEEEIRGMIPRDLVSRVYLECAVKDNLGHECVVYRIPGEIGFYGAKSRSGTRFMPEEENPAYWIREMGVAT